MRSIGVFILGLVVGCNTQPAPRPTSDPPKHTATVRELEDQTVALVAVGEGGAEVYCSGVWFSQWGIVTAAHCVDDVHDSQSGVLLYATRGDFTQHGVSVRTALVQVLDVPHDLALIHVLAPPVAHIVAQPYAGPLEVGSRVQTMGHPLGQYWYSYSSGDISSIRDREINGKARMLWIQSTAPISHGSSGGGLFDSEGRLLGIAAGIDDQGENVNVFIHWQYADELIRSQGAGR